MFYKRLLDFIQLALATQSFDCGDVFAIRLRGKNHAGVDWLSIQQNSACSAFAGFASTFYAVISLTPQYVEQ
jgi:hypothetical protein